MAWLKDPYVISQMFTNVLTATGDTNPHQYQLSVENQFMKLKFKNPTGYRVKIGMYICKSRIDINNATGTTDQTMTTNPTGPVTFTVPGDDPIIYFKSAYTDGSDQQGGIFDPGFNPYMAPDFVNYERILRKKFFWLSPGAHKSFTFKTGNYYIPGQRYLTSANAYAYIHRAGDLFVMCSIEGETGISNALVSGQTVPARAPAQALCDVSHYVCYTYAYKNKQTATQLNPGTYPYYQTNAVSHSTPNVTYNSNLSPSFVVMPMHDVGVSNLASNNYASVVAPT